MSELQGRAILATGRPRRQRGRRAHAVGALEREFRLLLVDLNEEGGKYDECLRSRLCDDAAPGRRCVSRTSWRRHDAAAASRMVRGGGVIVHAGPLPGSEAASISAKLRSRRSHLPAPIATRRSSFANLSRRLAAWTVGFRAEEFGQEPAAFHDLESGAVKLAKIVLRPYELASTTI